MKINIANSTSSVWPLRVASYVERESLAFHSASDKFFQSVSGLRLPVMSLPIISLPLLSALLDLQQLPILKLMIILTACLNWYISFTKLFQMQRCKKLNFFWLYAPVSTAFRLNILVGLTVSFSFVDLNSPYLFKAFTHLYTFIDSFSFK